MPIFQDWIRMVPGTWKIRVFGKLMISYYFPAVLKVAEAAAGRKILILPIIP
jgi:hypothetical protein